MLRAALLAVALLVPFALACGDDGPGTPTGPSPATNRAPVAVGSISAQTLPLGESVRLDMAQYFSDPDGDALTYEATSSDTHVATVGVSESTVSVTAEHLGQTDIRVSVSDPQGTTAVQSFLVTVEVPGFTLSGTVSDSRRNGPLIAGAVVELDNGKQESMTTGPDGRYRFLNVSGTVTVTATAEPSYLTDTVQIAMNADRTVDFALEHTGTPPFEGTVFITPSLVDSSDPTSLRSVTFAGRGTREFWDRPAERWITVNAYLFDVQFTGRELEFQVHPEFGSREAARSEVDTYAAPLGRIPAVLLSRTKEVEISASDNGFQGNAAGIFHVYTGYGEELIGNGFLEELFIHEGGHASLDDVHADSAGWRTAQEADRVFISTYAQDNPQREDVAESILPYFALRYRPERLTEADRAAIAAAIPNRLAYFNEQAFDMSPYRATKSMAPVSGLSSVGLRQRIWKPFEGPPTR